MLVRQNRLEVEPGSPDQVEDIELVPKNSSVIEPFIFNSTVLEENSLNSLIKEPSSHQDVNDQSPCSKTKTTTRQSISSFEDLQSTCSSATADTTCSSAPANTTCSSATADTTCSSATADTTCSSATADTTVVDAGKPGAAECTLVIQLTATMATDLKRKRNSVAPPTRRLKVVRHRRTESF